MASIEKNIIYPKNIEKYYGAKQMAIDYRKEMIEKLKHYNP